MDTSLNCGRLAGMDPALLLIHGAGGSRLSWPPELRRRPGVYGLDLPGHGRSDDQGFDTLEQYADWVKNFVVENELSSVVLCGHSMGGGIAQLIALRHPPWLSQLILVGTGARLRVHPMILEGIRKNFKETVRLSVRWSFGPGAPTKLIEQTQRELLKTDPSVLHRDFLACDRLNIMEAVCQIDVPTLIIAGSEDQMAPPKYSEFLHQQIKGSRLVIIPGAGHMVMLEKTAEFLEALRFHIR